MTLSIYLEDTRRVKKFSLAGRFAGVPSGKLTGVLDRLARDTVGLVFFGGKNGGMWVGETHSVASFRGALTAFEQDFFRQERAAQIARKRAGAARFCSQLVRALAPPRVAGA